MKTTIGSELYPIWRICQCRNYERNGVFKNDDAGKDSLKAIKVELQTNERLIADYGRFMPTPDEAKRFGYKWTEHKFDVAGRTRKSRSSTVNFVGYSGQVLGVRCHHGHCDDAVTEEIGSSGADPQVHELAGFFFRDYALSS